MNILQIACLISSSILLGLQLGRTMERWELRKAQRQLDADQRRLAKGRAALRALAESTHAELKGELAKLKDGIAAEKPSPTAGQL